VGQKKLNFVVQCYLSCWGMRITPSS